MKRLKGVFFLDPEAKRLVYGDDEVAEIASRVDLMNATPGRLDADHFPSALADADLIFSGWGAPKMDEAFLARTPKLKVVFYAAGAIGDWATPALFMRGVRVTTAIAANSRPVAEYTLSTILFSLKHGWRLQRQTAQSRRFVERDSAPGAFRSTVGLVSMGTIARLVVELLKPFDVNVITYDPFLSDRAARDLGVRKTSIETLFTESDVVSIHTPETIETRGMITGRLIASMKPDATLINTARGGLIRQSELVDVLKQRCDLQAVLDVCDPEPPAADCPLFDLPNVFLTPHIAGSTGRECRRLGQCMVQELQRYCAGERLQWEVQHGTQPPLRTKVSVAPLAAVS